MARHLHTAVGDEIREIARTDPERAAEMRATSVEYANEVRGFYDYDDDPADHEDDGRDIEPDDEPSDAEQEGGAAT